VQWYWKVPAVGNGTENCAPGATMPESQPCASDVDVCAIESEFVHVTVVPAVTSTASGLYARLPSTDAFVGIVMDDEATGAGAGDGDVDDAAEPLPHPAAKTSMVERIARRDEIIGSSERGA